MKKENPVFELKGSLFTFTVMHLLTVDLQALAEQLVLLVKQTPKFFLHMPLVIDIQKLEARGETIHFQELCALFKKNHIIPVGIRGGNEKQQADAIAAGLALLPKTKSDIHDVQAATPKTQPASFAKIIHQPIRSGQQIYARQTDLIVLAPVSAGAELLADGNIHIYNTLRGRALAGVSGNENSRIFCQQLDAELVAIAGHYWVSEDLHKSTIKQNAQIFLENNRLNLTTF